MKLNTIFVAITLALLATGVAAQDNCANRGQLDTLYCDVNNDLVADVPSDPAKQRDPSTLVFAWSPTENPAVYKSIYEPIMTHLQTCTAKRVAFFNVQSNSAQIEAQRAGRLHVALYATGAIGFAVNMAGGVPFIGMGNAQGVGGYQVYAIVKSSSPFQKLADLKGRKVAHVSPTSNSGNLAPRVFFADEGLKPDTDYKPLMSGGHDKSIIGVSLGDYEAAAVASDIFERMTARNQVKAEDFRIIWKSQVFPTTGFVMSHDLKPELQKRSRIAWSATSSPTTSRRSMPAWTGFSPSPTRRPGSRSARWRSARARRTTVSPLRPSKSGMPRLLRRKRLRLASRQPSRDGCHF